MDGAQLRRRTHVRLTPVADDLVGDAKFLQQPQHALRAGVVEMMNGEHCDSPQPLLALLRAIRWCQPRAGKSRCPERGDITRMLLTDEIYPGNIGHRISGAFMNPASDIPCIAFEDDRCIATGGLREVARAAKQTLDRRKDASVLVFDGMTGGPIALNFRGTVDDVLARVPDMADGPVATEDAAVPAPRGPGRPKLGVVAREVTLLPRHWEWLAQQSGGASVALRRLVEEARRANRDKDRVRH